MNLFKDIRDLLLEVLENMVASGELISGLDFSNVTVEPPRDPLHGDMATNAAMVLAKPSSQNPREIAEKLSRHLMADHRISVVDVAGPGFLNLQLSLEVWRGLVSDILRKGNDFGRSYIGAGKSVIVEFVSANPTGPLHVGHTRGAVFGDALADLLSYVGYDVKKEYYINDGGAQVDVLARSVYLRYLEAHGQKVAFEEGTYPGDYLILVGEALKDKFGTLFVDKEEFLWLGDIREFATNMMMDLIRDDLSLLGVKMDAFFSEKSLFGTGRIEQTIQKLKNQGLIYEGVLEPPRGKRSDDWEPRNQTLFKSTEHGDDVDRPVMKSDGSWTYFTPDIAYHDDKVKRGFDLLIDVLGADHGGYVKRMKAAVSALSGGKVQLEVKLIQLVKLFENGEPLKMSKRAGTFVTLRDMVEQVGVDVTRFMMLTRKNDAPLDFDLGKVLEQSRDNPVFYVQYAHARGCSVLRRASEKGIDVSDADLLAANLNYLCHESEMTVVKKLAEWPRLVEISGRTNEPHRVAFYLYELASDFHALWNRGNVEPSVRFLQEDDFVTSQAKIALVRSVCIVISAGLGILGVKPMEEMR